MASLEPILRPLRAAVLARPRLTLGLLIAAGAALRLWVCTMGMNFDLLSFYQTGRLVSHGENVYLHNTYYNYGYPAALVFGQLFDATMALGRHFGGHPGKIFHLLLVVLLCAADAGIMLILRRRVSARAGWLFYFNPVSIILTGFHSQFDNVAILLALHAAEQIGAGRAFGARKWVGIGLLGLSLSVKHVCFLLPLWLALRERRWRAAAAVLIVPPALFLLGFAPFWKAAGPQIVQGVFLYRSFENGTLPHLLTSLPGLGWLPQSAVFLVGLVACGVYLRRERAFNLALMYLVAVVVFSSAVANQTLAIPLAGISAFMNPFYAAYTALTTWFLIGIPPGLGVEAVGRAMPPMLAPADSMRRWDCLIGLLLAGFIWMLGRLRRTARRDAAVVQS